MVLLVILEELGFELNESTYTKIFFNSKYYSAIQSVVEYVDVEEP